MRISHSKKFIFLSNRKCASESIREMLDPYSEIKSATFAQPFNHHVTARKLNKAFKALGWDWTDYYSFTTIRNPWAKVVSAFEFGGLKEESKWHTRRQESGDDFEAFIDALPDDIKIENFGFDKDGNQLVNEIIRVEDLPQRLPRLFEELEIEYPALVHKNKSTSHDYREYYSDATRQAVADLFQIDIAIGGYEF